MAESRLTEAQIESLIELWRVEECLWKTTNSDFMDVDVRRIALQKRGHIHIARLCLILLLFFNTICAITRALTATKQCKMS